MIFVTAEDDPQDTIRPRLDAHNADVNRIHLLSGVQRTEDGKTTELVFTLSDIEVLEEALVRVPDCSLVVIDPIGSFLGGRCDAHRDNEVRSVLAPLAKLAEQHGVAVLMVAHRRRSVASSADDTVLGSRAFTGLARSVWHVSRDPDDDRRRLLLPGKSNLAASTTGLAFTISGEPASVNWDYEPVQMSADDALALETGNATGEMSALDEAVAWLAEHLATGPQSGKAVRKAAEADGIANRTLDRARCKLQVKAEPDGFGGPWVWRLPKARPSECTSIVPESAEYAKENVLAHTEDTVAHSDDACSHCGSTDLREVPIHDGQSVRRDCTRCNKTVDFPVWRPA